MSRFNGLTSDVSRSYRPWETSTWATAFWRLKSRWRHEKFYGKNLVRLVVEMGDCKINHMGVSKNRGTPKSFILIRFSIIFTIHFGVPLFSETSIWGTWRKHMKSEDWTKNPLPDSFCVCRWWCHLWTYRFCDSFPFSESWRWALRNI